MYARAHGDEHILVVLNPRAEAASAEFTLKPAAKKLKLLAGKKLKVKNKGGDYNLTIPGRSYAIYKLLK